MVLGKVGAAITPQESGSFSEFVFLIICRDFPKCKPIGSLSVKRKTPSGQATREIPCPPYCAQHPPLRFYKFHNQMAVSFQLVARRTIKDNVQQPGWGTFPSTRASMQVIVSRTLAFHKLISNYTIKFTQFSLGSLLDGWFIENSLIFPFPLHPRLLFFLREKAHGRKSNAISMYAVSAGSFLFSLFQILGPRQP